MKEKIEKNKIFDRVVLVVIFVISIILLSPLTTKSAIDDKTIKSIVQIRCSIDEGIKYGSGVVVSNDGYILTNKHVISNSSEIVYTGCDIAITENKNLAPDFSYKAKSIIWSSKDSGLDIALLKIETNKTDFSCIPLYTFGFPNLGVSVNALGYPITGGDAITQTHGYVTYRIKDQDSFARYFIATDAKLAHGNSGGGAFTDYDEFLGITSANLANKFNTVGLIIPVLIIRDFLYINDYKFLIHEKDSGFYQYKENQPSSPRDVGNWPIKIENITDNSMDVCWPSLFIQGSATRYKADSFEFIIHSSTDGSNYTYKDTTKGIFKSLSVDEKSVGYYCYTSQNLLPATTYYFKLYTRFYSDDYYYYHPFLDSDFSNPISATTNNTILKCTENSTLIGGECICNDGYLMNNEQCITNTEDCINYFGQNVYGEKGDNNSLCHCLEGYEWNVSQTACIKYKKAEEVQIKKSLIPELVLKEILEKESKEDIKENQEEKKEEKENQQESIETIENQQLESEQSKVSLTEESESKNDPSILGNILNTVKDFFVKLFSIFK